MSVRELREIVSSSDNIVFFGGAGVSTESGIPDYRSAGGLYSRSDHYSPETILSHSFFESHPEEFYAFYRDKLLHLEAKPNSAHIALAKLERTGRLRAVITQNVDGLHQQAGGKTVLELHGSVHRNYCTQCKKSYGVAEIAGTQGVPRCGCGGVIRPDVVLYEESLNMDTLERAVRYITDAQVLIVGGTSLNVYPAAGLLEYYTGGSLVIINKSPTQADRRADLLIADSLGKILGEL